jgi:serine/threonine protein kinase/tetratricopeptide (TPR) repeat protein
MQEELPIRESISHYRILDKLGAGGMGEVYLAEDTRLGRHVALKFLPASYQYDPDRRARFLKEARAASALRSPNIAAIYDIDEFEGAIFIVMEYIKGELLSARIERGSVAVSEAIDTAMQIADALDEAHSNGIIHRDIKSSNLIINERGLIKILDFGIAKVEERQSKEDADRTMRIVRQTALGAVFGTVWYMSPEQALGRQLDHRTDIFSLGVVFYEMLAGRLPFEGDGPNETIDKIVHAMPLPTSRYNDSVPPELERITRKCLEKSPDLRYQSMRELLIDLQSFKRDSDSAQLSSSSGRQTQLARRPRSRKAIDSLAILPFINASRDADADYLSDGITESIISNLSQLPRLRVMARSTVFRFKQRTTRGDTASQQMLDPRAVATELGVRAVLVGRVLCRNDRLIIEAELVDGFDGSRLWGEHYNREISDIFALEEEISREISDNLRLKLTGQQKKRLTKRRTESAEAYQAYLKGRYFWNKRTADSMKKAVEHFEQAIDLDPNYAMAYVGLADAYLLLGVWNALPPADVMPKARAAAERALEIDEAFAEAHATLAFSRLVYDWNPLAAESEFNRSIHLNPKYATARQWHAYNLAAMGRFDEAIAEIQRAERLDPLSTVINSDMAELCYWAGQYERTIQLCHKAIEMDAEFVPAHFVLGFAYEATGRIEEAIARYKKARELSGDDTWIIGILGHAYGVSGRRAEAERLLDELKEMAARETVSPYNMAVIYAGLGENDSAFVWLEMARLSRASPLAFINIEPFFNDLRADPRFLDLLERMGLFD